jgi:predicted dehydrogenase
VSLRLAVFGTGFIADMHVRAAEACGNTVSVVAGHDLPRTNRFAAVHGIRRATTDWEAVASDAEIDAVVVGTPNALHHPQTMAALSAGKHVLVDKPMAMTVGQAAIMQSTAEAAGLTIVVGHMWRYRDEVVAMRDRIRDGSIGTPVRTRGYGIHAGWGPSGWFTDPELSGGGALIDMGIHAIDTVRFLLGDPQPVRVVASLGTAYGDYAVDDDGIVLIDWSTGVRSVIETGWWQPRLDGVEADTEVYGTKGYERIWPHYTPATPAAAGYVHCTLPMYAAQMADFVRCCATGATPVASAEVGVTALQIVETAYRTARDVPGHDVR